MLYMILWKLYQTFKFPQRQKVPGRRNPLSQSVCCPAWSKWDSVGDCDALQGFIRFACSWSQRVRPKHFCETNRETDDLAWNTLRHCNIAPCTLVKHFQKDFQNVNLLTQQQLHVRETFQANPSNRVSRDSLHSTVSLMSLIHTAAMFWFKIAATSCEAVMYRHSMDFCEIWNMQSCAKEHLWHHRSEGSSQPVETLLTLFHSESSGNILVHPGTSHCQNSKGHLYFCSKSKCCRPGVLYKQWSRYLRYLPWSKLKLLKKNLLGCRGCHLTASEKCSAVLHGSHL